MSFLSRLLSRSYSTTTANPKFIGSAITEIFKDTNLKRVVEKFKKSSEIPRFRTNSGIYTGTVRRLANAKRFRWIEEILEHQKQYHDMSKEGFAARIISLYGKAGMFENASKVFDEMPGRNCKQSVLSFNALLGACVNSEKFDEVDVLFKDLPKKLGIEPDLVSYNTVIKAYVDKGSLDSARSVLDDMKKKTMAPDLITFNTLLLGFYSSGRFADAEKIWERMVSQNVRPNIRSYNAKLSGLAMEKKMKEAVELVEEMRGREISPDFFTFDAVIKGFVSEGNLEEAKQWYNSMEESGCSVNKSIHKLLVPFLCEKGDLDFAYSICKETFAKKRLIDKELLQLVVDRLAKESKIEKAKELMDLGKTNNYCRYTLKSPVEE